MIVFFFFNDTATTEIYTLSLHDALPIYQVHADRFQEARHDPGRAERVGHERAAARPELDQEDPRRPAQVQPVLGQRQADERSEEHTSELQSRQYLVCRLLLEKKK